MSVGLTGLQRSFAQKTKQKGTHNDLLVLDDDLVLELVGGGQGRLPFLERNGHQLVLENLLQLEVNSPFRKDGHQEMYMGRERYM